MKTIKNCRNPLLPLDIHIPDGEPHVMPDGKLYIYGSFDDRENDFCSGSYYVSSTGDGMSWTVYDKAFSADEIPWYDEPNDYPSDMDWSKPTPYMKKMAIDGMKQTTPVVLLRMLQASQKASERILFAPDCIYKDGKFYLYFCTAKGHEGVAVSDKPEGPFLNPIRLRTGGIDPAVFIDDDGKAYLYLGQFHSRAVELNEDMVSFEPEKMKKNVVTEEEHFFHEGSSIRKIGNTYYYIFADVERGKPTALGYATSGSPLGPFQYRGIIIDNAECDPKSWNNHGSIEYFNGDWYVFYHRSSRNTSRWRRMCAEKLTILEDGTIPEVKMTSQGMGDQFKSGEVIMGYQACGLKGKAYIDVDDKYGEKITNIHKGDEIIFRYIQGTNTYQTLKMASRGVGKMHVFIDQVLAGTLENGITCQLAVQNLPIKTEGYEVRLKCVGSKGLELRKLRFK